MALRYRAMGALAKGLTMGVFGLWVIGTLVWHAAISTYKRLQAVDAALQDHWLLGAPGDSGGCSVG